MSLTDNFELRSSGIEPANPAPGKRRKREAPFAIRLSKDERARLERDAAGAPLGAYIKAKVFGTAPPVRMRRTGLAVEDRQALAQALALLGRSRLTRRHRADRIELDARHRTEWDAQTRARSARLPKGLRGLWHRLTGRYQEIRALNEAEALRARERQARERHQLIERQLAERATLQAQFRDLRKKQAEQLLALRADIGRFLKLSRAHARTVERARGLSSPLKLER
jgi:hypothetical protein